MATTTMTKADIESIQDKLVRLNILGEKFRTGTINPQTVDAIKELQAFLRVPLTGIYDVSTTEKLNQEWRRDHFTRLFHHFNPSSGKIDIKDKNNIYAIQDLLIKYKVFSPKDRTGIYDQKTFEAVKILQNTYGLRPTGLFNKELESEVNKNPQAIMNVVRKYDISDTKGGGLLWKSIKQDLNVTKLPTQNSFLFYDGNYLCWVSNKQVVKKWRALSGRYFWADQLQGKISDKIKGDAGPLPPGRYNLAPIQEMKYKLTDYSIFDLIKYDSRKLFYSEPETHSVIDFPSQQKNVLTHIGWGNWRIPIIGKKFGRSRFYIHGGGIISSSGCIDVGDDGMENIFKSLAATYGSKGYSLPLLVFYGSSAEEVLKNENLLAMIFNSNTDQQSDALISKTVELINAKNAAEAKRKKDEAAAAEQKRKAAAAAEQRRKEAERKRKEEEEEKNSFWGRIKGLAGLS